MIPSRHEAPMGSWNRACVKLEVCRGCYVIREAVVEINRQPLGKLPVEFTLGLPIEAQPAPSPTKSAAIRTTAPNSRPGGFPPGRGSGTSPGRVADQDPAPAQGGKLFLEHYLPCSIARVTFIWYPGITDLVIQPQCAPQAIDQFAVEAVVGARPSTLDEQHLTFPSHHTPESSWRPDARRHDGRKPYRASEQPVIAWIPSCLFDSDRYRLIHATAWILPSSARLAQNSTRWMRKIR